MTARLHFGSRAPGLYRIDPRGSLAAGVAWLIIALAMTFSAAAALWVGRIARANILEQHARRLSLETDQLSFDVGQALSARLDAITGVERLLESAPRAAASADDARHETVFDEITAAYPELDWILWASADGHVLRAAAPIGVGSDVGARSWFRAALAGPWLGDLGVPAAPAPASASAHLEQRDTLGDLAAPVRDSSGRLIGVIAARLSWRRAAQHPQRLTDEPEPYGPTQAYVLDRAGIVRLGPAAAIGRPWEGVPETASPGDPMHPRFEQLRDGRRVLVAAEPLNVGARLEERGWHVLLSEPVGRVYQRADALAYQILWASLALGGATALLGVLGARHLTRRLDHLTRSVAALGPHAEARVEIPAGRDEVGKLARAFDGILGELQKERQELKSLSSELERRVAVRTAEVERLAEETRYAAIVRERLQIARDLHDTLTHSMMALLSEIRFMRRLQKRDPGALPQELERAEQVAREGLHEARAAIAQMRGHAVREIGLGPAIARELERFRDRTGLGAELESDPESARFGDERAELLLRMVQESLRNVERHARATRVRIALATTSGPRLEVLIEDDGAGFDAGAPHPGHFGLIGLREQAELIGASLEIDSAPAAGTRITISLPISPIAFGP
jgi:signal transduction histidine kinase